MGLRRNLGEQEGPEHLAAEGVRARWVPASRGGTAYLPVLAASWQAPCTPILAVSVGLGDPQTLQ